MVSLGLIAALWLRVAVHGFNCCHVICFLILLSRLIGSAGVAVKTGNILQVKDLRLQGYDDICDWNRRYICIIGNTVHVCTLCARFYRMKESEVNSSCGKDKYSTVCLFKLSMYLSSVKPNHTTHIQYEASLSANKCVVNHT